MTHPRKGSNPGHEPWCWQHKAQLREIREAFDAENTVSSGLLVYFVLSEIRSDKQSDTFITTHAFISMRSGLSPRTVQQRIKDLVQIGIIKCDVPSLRAPASYTILPPNSHPDKQSIPNVMQPLHNVVNELPNDQQRLPSVTQRSKKALLPTLEESLEKSSKNKANNPNSQFALGSVKANEQTTRLVELVEMCKEVLGQEEIKLYHERWLRRAEKQPDKLVKVIAEIRRMLACGEIATTPARAAEDYWKRLP